MSRYFAGLPTWRYSDPMLRRTRSLFRWLLRVCSPWAIGAILGLGLAAAATPGQRALFTVDDVLRAEPSPSAAIVARLPAGQAVTLGERRGFWRRVDRIGGVNGDPGTAGWVRLSTLRLPNSRPAPGLAALDTGREAAGNTALVSGARSVAGRDTPVTVAALRAVTGDEGALSSLAGSTVDAAMRIRFIAEGGLGKRPLATRGERVASGRSAVGASVTTKALEREVASKIFGLVRPVSDSALQRYVGQLGDVLIHAEPEPAPLFNWRFVVLDTPSLISFALPDGLVLVSRGLFAELSSEDELAAVLAREIIHVRNRHHWRAARAPSIETYLRPIDADLEFRADAEGMRLAAAAGYDSTALIAVLERIDTATAAGRDTTLLRTLMPSVSDRIATLAAAATPELERAAVPSAAASRIRRFGGGGA